MQQVIQVCSGIERNVPIEHVFFSSHTSLRRHEQKHQGINYKCGKCTRSFNDPSNLRRHEQSCNGETMLSEDEIEQTGTTGPGQNGPNITSATNITNQHQNIKKEEKEEVKPHRCGYCSKVSYMSHNDVINESF